MVGLVSMLALALATVSPIPADRSSDVRAVSTGSTVHKVGLCRVRTLTASGAGESSATRSFLIDTGTKRLIVAPVAGTSWAVEDRDKRVDAVLLTSLSEDALSGLVVGDTVAYGNSRIFVDRDLLEAAKESVDRSSRRNLDLVLASGRLYLPEANVDVLPGVRFAIPPRRSTGSRVQIRCGDQTLIVLDGGELVSSGFDRLPAITADSDDPAHIRSLAGDRATLAIISGPFPALASIYRDAEGFRLGSIEAKEFGGAAPRRGQVIVENSPSP